MPMWANIGMLAWLAAGGIGASFGLMAADLKIGTWDIVTVDGPIVESSGLARSRTVAGQFWTHNDSGSDPVLYRINSQAQVVGQHAIVGVNAIDWESLAEIDINGKSYLLIGDVGDNNAGREFVELHLVAEPPDDANNVPLVPIHSYRLRYQDGPRNCEAMAIDRRSESLIMITKSTLPWCGVYQIPLAQMRLDAPGQATDLIAKRAGNFAMPMVTGFDIDDSSGDWLVSSYFQLLLLPYQTGGVDEMLRTAPVIYEAPRINQIEACCLNQGKIVVTSEGHPFALATMIEESR